jgi:hypothetical protein
VQAELLKMQGVLKKGNSGKTRKYITDLLYKLWNHAHSNCSSSLDSMALPWKLHPKALIFKCNGFTQSGREIFMTNENGFREE